MARKLTVVISQGQSANPARRKLEEDLVAGLLMERGLEVTVIPHLYDLPPDGTGMLCLQSIRGDLVVLSWLFPRAAQWTLDRNGILGRVGKTLLVGAESDEDEEDEEDEETAEQAEAKKRVIDDRPIPNRSIYCLDLRVKDEPGPFVEEIRRIAREATVETVELGGLMQWIQGAPRPEQLARYLDPAGGTAGGGAVVGGTVVGGNGNGAGVVGGIGKGNGHVREQPGAGTAALPIIAQDTPAEPVRITEETGRRWYPVIDYSRCTNCLECLDFCLFGVYGVGNLDTILVEQPDNCRKGCPACSRVCPENAIIFPQHKTPAIAGSADGVAGGLKIDLSKLFGAPDALEVAVLERDVELVAVGRDAVGMNTGIPKRQDGKDQGPKDDLDQLMDKLDDLDL